MPLTIEEKIDLIIKTVSQMKNEIEKQTIQMSALDKRLSNQRIILAVYSLATSGIVAAIISKFV